MHCGVCCVSVSFHTYIHVGITHGHGCTQNFYSAVDKHIHNVPIYKYAIFTLDVNPSSYRNTQCSCKIMFRTYWVHMIYIFLQYKHKRITFLCKSHFTTILAVLYFCLPTSMGITRISIQINEGGDICCQVCNLWNGRAFAGIFPLTSGWGCSEKIKKTST